MRIKITGGGIYDGQGKEIPIGTELTLKDEPTAWAGRYETVGKTDGKEPVTNEDGDTEEVAALRKQFDGAYAEVTKRAEAAEKRVEEKEAEIADLRQQIEQAKAAKDNGTSDQPASFTARDTGSGWWTIFDADGKEVGKKLRKDDGEAFNTLSDADKAEFVKEQG